MTLRSVHEKCHFQQGSILGPLLFSIYICDMLFETPANIDFAGYAEDNTPYTHSLNIENVLDNLQWTLEKKFHWRNHLVAKEGKWHLLISSKRPVDIHIPNTEILNEEKVKLLGVNLESRLSFDFYLNTLFEKGSKKYHALARVRITWIKKTTYSHKWLHNISVFLLSPLIWMSQIRTMNNIINKTHGEALRRVYKNETNLSLVHLLKKSKSVSIHQRNLQALATEIYKVRIDLVPEIMKKIFTLYENHTIWKNDSALQRRRRCTVYVETKMTFCLTHKAFQCGLYHFQASKLFLRIVLSLSLLFFKKSYK